MTIHQLVTTLLFAVLFHSSVSAQWWNPLAPKDANDCIIKNLKNGMGEDAVRALRFACFEKYPPQQTDAEKREENRRKIRMSKCNLSDDHYKYHSFFTINENRITSLMKHIDAIKIEEYDGKSASVQNKNSFAISGVAIGLTGAKSCGLNTDSYEAIAYCKSGRTDSGVISAMSFGRFNCTEVPRKTRAMNYCVIGYSPRYQQFDESLLKFKEDNGLCSQ